MTTHELSTIHDDLGDVIRQIAPGSPVLLNCGGAAIGALVSMEDLRLLEHYLEELEERIDLAEAVESLDEAERDGTVPYAIVRQAVYSHSTRAATDSTSSPAVSTPLAVERMRR